MSDLSYLRKAAFAGFAALLITTAYEMTKEATLSNLTRWQSHAMTILYCAGMVFFLCAILLRRAQFVSAGKLHASMALSDSLIESLPGMVCIFNAAGNIRRWNPNFLGYSPADILGAGIMGTVAPESLNVVQETMKTAFANGRGEAEAWLVAKSGAKLPCYLIGVRIIFQNEPCILGIAIDISKRKRAEEHGRLQSAALESAANAIAITDARGAIQWVNPAFTRLTGYTLEEAVGRNPRILKSGMQDESFYQDLWTTILAGQAWAGEITNRKKDGQLYIEEMTVAPVCSETGDITNFVAIKQDITARKQIEAELVSAKDNAERANRAKSEFLANMSHELRTPMNGVLGMTDLALETELTSEQREYLILAKSSADSLLTIINDILDFSRVEAGKLEFESIEFNLRGSVETTVKALAVRAQAKGLELNCHVHREVPETLVGDPTRLRQIIVNLVGNAIKFTQQGEVTIEVQQEAFEPERTVLHFAVTDTGAGVPKDKQAAIFEAFTQADGSTSRRFGGSGLGLTISRRLVEMFGGRLWLESAAGQGSTFHFTARFGIGAQPTLKVALPDVNLDGMPVLVVDDNSTNRRILEELLRGWRIQPTGAESAIAAHSCLKEAVEARKPFPLLLVDAAMPDVDGFAFVKQIKQDARMVQPAIIMLTSSGSRGDGARCRELGIAAYLTKPIGQSELFTAIVEVLGASHGEVAKPSLVTRHSIREQKQGLRILLAEDNRVNQAVVRGVLGKRGHHIEIATDGREALEKIKNGSFDLVLMDVQMPELDGLQATALIRQAEKTTGGHLPIIAMTAHALKGDRERCLAAGMDGYTSKPIRLEDLLREIEDVLQLQF